MLRKLLCLLCALMLPLSALASDRPLIVSVGLSSDTVRMDDRSVKAAGVGKRAPWGIHEADVIYETLCYQTGQTRLGCLFSSRFPEAVGPVRSARVSHFALQTEWNAVLVYNGDAGSAAWEWLDGLDRASERLLDARKNSWLRSYTLREKGIKAPDNLSIHALALADALSLSPAAPELSCAAVSGAPVTEISLDWGNDDWQTRLLYDPDAQHYRMFRRDVPFLSLIAPQDRDHGIPLAFDCIVVQQVDYQWPSQVIPVMTGVGSGTAQLYMNGQQYPCTWVKESIDSPTRYLDERGQEIRLPESSVYIAQFPAGQTFRTDAEKRSIAYQYTGKDVPRK